MRAAEYVVETSSSSPSSQEVFTFGSQDFRRVGRAVIFTFGRLELLQKKKGGTHMYVTQEDNHRQVKLIRTITREGN